MRRVIEEVIDSGEFCLGHFVEDFERDFSGYCGTREAIGVGSGTDALWLSMMALGVGPGDEVITVPMTFFATVEAISMTGAKPVFVDVDELTYTMNPDLLERAITSKTKAIIPVHLFGHPADMDPILEIAGRFGIHVIEDASQAHGTRYKGRKVGSLGVVGCFSFYPAKNLGAIGEGGAVTTDNSSIAEKIRRFRNHGQTSKNKHSSVGWNSRLDGIQAAVLALKLKRLDLNNSLRRNVAKRYFDALKSVGGLRLPIEAEFAFHSYHIFAIQVEDRAHVMNALDTGEIGHSVHYPIPVHLQTAYLSLGYRAGDFPVSEQCAGRFLSIPVYPELRSEEVAAVIDTVRNCLVTAAAN